MSTFFTTQATQTPPDYSTPPESFFDPPGGKRPWYRRGWFLVACVAIVVVGAAVIADLPHHTSDAAQATEATTFIKSVDTDVRTCTYSLEQAYTIYDRDIAGTLTASDRAQVPGLLSGDEQACTFTNQTVVDLGTLTVPTGAAGNDLGHMVTAVLDWMTSDSVSAIDDMQTLVAKPHDAKAHAGLVKAEKMLHADRAAADADVRAAERVLHGAHLPFPNLPKTPDPS